MTARSAREHKATVKSSVARLPAGTKAKVRAIPEPKPLPPSDFEGRDLAMLTLRKGTALYKFCVSSQDPLQFDRNAAGRFSAPDGAFGVLYAARRPAGAFAETFLRNPGRTMIPPDLLATRVYTRLELTQRLRLARMGGPGLARMGATAEVAHRSRPYDLPQTWSRALHAHPLNVDGIAYTARHDDDELCVAIFDRAAECVILADRQEDIDQDWLWELAERYGVGLAP